VPVANAHRVLQAEGTLAPGFPWPNGRKDDPIDVLRSEGIIFDENLRADPVLQQDTPASPSRSSPPPAPSTS
jgi:hypothetical protein